YAEAKIALMNNRASPLIVADCALERVAKNEAGNLWPQLFREWLKSGFAEHVVVLDRGGETPRIPGLRMRSAPAVGANEKGEARIVQNICDDLGGDVFLSARDIALHNTTTVFLHGMRAARKPGLTTNSPASPEHLIHARATELFAIEKRLREIAGK